MANYSNRIRRDLLKYGKKTICYIDEYDNGTFKVKTGKPSDAVCGDYLAVIAYEAEIAEDKGDYWTAPYSWIEYERTTVKAVYGAEGDKDQEATKWLQEALN